MSSCYCSQCFACTPSVNLTTLYGISIIFPFLQIIELRHRDFHICAWSHSSKRWSQIQLRLHTLSHCVWNRTLKERYRNGPSEISNPKEETSTIFKTLFYSYLPKITFFEGLVNFLSCFYVIGFALLGFLNINVIVLYIQSLTCNSEVCRPWILLVMTGSPWNHFLRAYIAQEMHF